MAWHFLPTPEALSHLEYLSLTHINWHAHLQAALTAPAQQTQTTNRACEASEQQRDVLSTLFTLVSLKRGNTMTSSQKQLRSCGSALSADPLEHWALCPQPVGCSNSCLPHACLQLPTSAASLAPGAPRSSAPTEPELCTTMLCCREVTTHCCVPAPTHTSSVC